jgi:hypothetical protein
MRRRFPGAYDSRPRLPLRETDDQQTLLSRMPHDQFASLIRRMIRIIEYASERIREYCQCFFERNAMLPEILACLRCVPLELRRRRSAHRRLRKRLQRVIDGIGRAVPELVALFGGLQPLKRPADVVEFLVGEYGAVLARMYAHHVPEGLEDTVLEHDLDAHAGHEHCTARAHRFGHHAKACPCAARRHRQCPKAASAVGA